MREFKLKILSFYEMIISCSTHLNLLASLSHSIRARVSPTLTGPFTFLIKVLESFPRTDTLTYEIYPLLPNDNLSKINKSNQFFR